MKFGTLLTLVTLSGFALSSHAQTTVFNDTFGNGSTVQSASPANPTANSTAYEWFQGGSAPSGQTIASGDLHLAERSTTSEIGEVQALFTGTPVTLATIGDYVDLTIVFVDTSGVLAGSTTSSSLNVGLFNAGGVKPNQGARTSNGTLTGGSQNWNGYVGKFFFTGGSNPQFQTRTPQTANGATSQNQDVIFDGQSGGGGYTNPAATSIPTTFSTAGATLTAASTYTLDYRITLSDVNTLTMSNALYSGTSVAGSPVINMIATTVDPSGVYSYDALSFGWRETFATAAASSVDINSINVNSLVQSVPEPSTIALSGIALAGLAFRRRWMHR